MPFILILAVYEINTRHENERVKNLSFFILAQEGILQKYPNPPKIKNSGILGMECILDHSSTFLDCLTLEEKYEINQLRWTYKDKFGFPFVICDKKNIIFEALKSRLDNNYGQELKNGIKEVLKICEFRIKDLIFDDSERTNVFMGWGPWKVK